MTVVVLLVGSSVAAFAQEDHDKPAVVRDGDRWFLRDVLRGGAADPEFTYGRDDNLFVMGDWNGNGTRTPGVIRVSAEGELVWFLRNHNSGGPADIVVRFGESRALEDFDQPVVGDWNGSGVATPGVVRIDPDRRNHEWHLRNRLSGGPGQIVFRYGVSGDTPLVGDWNDDGNVTSGVLRRHSQHWLLRQSNTPGPAQVEFRYGVQTDEPVVWR